MRCHFEVCDMLRTPRARNLVEALKLARHGVPVFRLHVPRRDQLMRLEH
jgi:hypothetical protein